jgi:hypothetical protein
MVKSSIAVGVLAAFGIVTVMGGVSATHGRNRSEVLQTAAVYSLAIFFQWAPEVIPLGEYAVSSFHSSMRHGYGAQSSR